jgi:Flp pilus assembly protein TadG
VTRPYRPGRRGDDGGSAVVEFVVLGTLLLLPVVYLVLAVGRIQAGSFAVDGGARAAARAYTTAADDADGQARAQAAVRLALLDQGFGGDTGQSLRVECSSPACLTPQARVSVQVTLDVGLPGVPGFLDRVIPAHVTVRAAHVAVVDAFRARPAVTP